MTADAEELVLLGEAARSWIADTAPLSARRDDGPEAGAQRWQAMVGMGWSGIAMPEVHGGLDLGFAALGRVQEELGRELLPAPLLSSALAGHLLQRVPGGQGEHWLPRLAAGAVVALAVGSDAQGRTPFDGVAAERTATGWHLRGRRLFVADGGAAHALIVAALCGEEPALFVVEGDQVRREVLRMVDGHDFAHLDFDVALDDTARLMVDDIPAQVARLLDLARIGMSAEMLGSADRALEIICDYLRVRKQFGQPIGSFQALQHRAALMLVDIELARSCVQAALEAADADSVDLPELAVAAKAMANDALHRVSNEIVQMHGGIGMTAEHVAGRYLKRARVAEALYGNTAALAQRYADIHGF